jgi:hypothetical protein
MMATTLSSEHTAALAFAPKPRSTRPTLRDWLALPRARQQILLTLHRNSQMMPTTELHEALDIPDLDAMADDMRQYVQRVHMPGVPPAADGGPNGVALTVLGADLVRWGAKHVVR